MQMSSKRQRKRNEEPPVLANNGHRRVFHSDGCIVIDYLTLNKEIGGELRIGQGAVVKSFNLDHRPFCFLRS